MSDEANYSRFLSELSKVLGVERVLDQSEAEARYGISTMGVKRIIPGAVRPVSRDDVIRIVGMSRDCSVPIYPISTGNNWGYGSANPVVDGCVVVDMSGLNRILSFDPESGLVTLEPGVTQRMLRAYLDEHGFPFLCPVTGAGPDCSLIGNALERGYGITPYADHFLSMMSLEAVLPDGRIYRPPLAELGCEAVDHAFKWGIGPYLDGIFSQGAFGVVTQMTIALAPIPERVEAFFFGVPRDEGLEEAVLGVRAALREVGGVLGSINLMNMHRVLSMMEPYPRDHLGAHGLIDEAYLLKMASRNQVMPWMGAGAIYGNARVVAAAKSVVKEKLSGVAKRLMFFTPNSVARFNRLSQSVPLAPGRMLQNIFGTLDKTLQLLAGAPSEIALPLAYWMSGNKPAAGEPMNPARDGCGLMWYSPLVPSKPATVRAYVQMVKEVCIAHRLEPLITLTSISDRCFDSTVPLLFDRQSPDDCARAFVCYQDLLERGRAIGCIPYRSTILSMKDYLVEDSPYSQAVGALKAALDPRALLSPGRYGY